MVEKVFIVGEKKYDKVSRQFKVFYEDGACEIIGEGLMSQIYSVPSGKTFYLRNVIVSNEAATGLTVILADGTTTGTLVEKFRIRVDANSTKEVTNLKGMIFSTGVVVAATVTGVVAVGGEVTEL